MVSKVLRKVVNALKDYDDVVKSLGHLPLLLSSYSHTNLSNYAASADPMPTAIIWGALSVIINVSQS